VHIIYCQSDLDPLWWGKLIWYDSVQKAEQEEDNIGATAGTAKYAIIASIQGSYNERVESHKVVPRMALAQAL